MDNLLHQRHLETNEYFLNKILIIQNELAIDYIFTTKMGGSNGNLTALKAVYQILIGKDLLSYFI